MINNLNWFTLIILLGTIQGFVLFVSIIRLKKGNLKTHRFLAYFILLISITLLGRFYYTSPNISLFEYKILFIGDLIIFLYGPLLYFYLLKLFTIKPTIKIWLHFLPVSAYTIFALPFMFANRQDFFYMIGNLGPIFRFMEVFAIAQNMFYLLLNWKTLKNFTNESETVLSFSQQIKFYKSIQVIIIIALCAWIFALVMGEFGPEFFSGYLGYHLVWIVLSGTVIAIGYYTMSNPEIFVMDNSLQKPESKGFDIEQLEKLGDHLQKIMETDKPYLEPKLTLAELSEKCEISTHQLSRVINEKYGKNFFEFVNTYRVEEFKQLVNTDPIENFTLLAIAYKAGFNSKTTFNTAFKKITSQTPKEYLKTVKTA